MPTYTTAMIDSSNRQLRKYSFDLTNWSLIGTGLTLAAGTNPIISSFDTDKIAYFSFALKKLKIYAFDSASLTWLPFGYDPFPMVFPSISPQNYIAFAHFYPKRLALYGYFDGINSPQYSLVNFDFNSTFLSLVGNKKDTGDASVPSICAVDNNEIAYISDNSDELRKYSRINNTFTLVGTPLPITCSLPRITGLSKNKIAFFDFTSKQLRAYTFNTTTLTWSLTSTPLVILGVNIGTISAISDDMVAFIDSGNQKLRAYKLTGTTWAQVGNELLVSSGNPYLAGFYSVAKFDNYNELPLDGQAVWPTSDY